MKNSQKGFTLFEVLISIFIAGVAILGLVKLELSILRSAQSSFNYSVAIVEANSLVDKVWMQLCDIENSNTVYDNVYEGWKSSLSGNLSGATSSASSTLNLQDKVIVSWADGHFNSADNIENNRVTLLVDYPDFTGKCF